MSFDGCQTHRTGNIWQEISHLASLFFSKKEKELDGKRAGFIFIFYFWNEQIL